MSSRRSKRELRPLAKNFENEEGSSAVQKSHMPPRNAVDKRKTRAWSRLFCLAETPGEVRSDVELIMPYGASNDDVFPYLSSRAEHHVEEPECFRRGSMCGALSPGGRCGMAVVSERSTSRPCALTIY